MSVVDFFGKKVVYAISYTINLFIVTYLAFRSAITNRSQNLRSIFSVISSQIYFTGWQALPLISVLGVSTAGIVVFQAISQFNFFGGLGSVGNLLVLVIVREVSPLLTALVVIARSGTAVASELGNMKVNREIEAFETMGIDPMSYIIFPRVLGGIISIVCLGAFFNLISLASGFVVARMMRAVSFSYYLDSLASAFTFADILLFMAKNIFSGFIIFTVSSVQGLSVSEGPFEVPQATTKAVMNSIIYVILFNISVTALFYLHQFWGVL